MTEYSEQKGLILTVPRAGIVVAPFYPDPATPKVDGVGALCLYPKFGAGVFLSGRCKADPSTRLVVASYVDDYFWDLGNDQSVDMLLAPFDSPRPEVEGFLVVKGIYTDFGYDLVRKFRRSGVEMAEHNVVVYEGPLGLDLTTGLFFEKNVIGRYKPVRLPEGLARQAAAFAKGDGRCEADGKRHTLRLYMDLRPRG